MQPGRLHLTERIALVEGLFKLFFDKLASSDEIAAFITRNRRDVFEYSRGLFSSFLKALRAGSIHNPWVERETFVS